MSKANSCSSKLAENDFHSYSLTIVLINPFKRSGWLGTYYNLHLSRRWFGRSTGWYSMSTIIHNISCHYNELTIGPAAGLAQALEGQVLAVTRCWQCHHLPNRQLMNVLALNLADGTKRAREIRLPSNVWTLGNWPSSSWEFSSVPGLGLSSRLSLSLHSLSSTSLCLPALKNTNAFFFIHSICYWNCLSCHSN